MKDGEIIERGSHKDLMKQDGYYKGLYESQFKSEILDDESIIQGAI